MHLRHHFVLEAALLAVLASCAQQAPVPDPFVPLFRGLEPASISDISVSGSSDDSRPLSVAPGRWPSLLTLLQTLQPALDVRVEPSSPPSGVDWQPVGTVFITLRASPASMSPGRPAFLRFNIARHSRSHAVVAFVYSSRDQLMLPYRGSALLAWLRPLLRGA